MTFTLVSEGVTQTLDPQFWIRWFLLRCADEPLPNTIEYSDQIANVIENDLLEQGVDVVPYFPGITNRTTNAIPTYRVSALRKHVLVKQRHIVS